MNPSERTKNLEELEGVVWPHDDFGSHVVEESQRLRKVPVGELSVEDLRLLIGQKIGLPHLVPLALERLGLDPLASGAYFRGDLLRAVLDVPEEFWASHLPLRYELLDICTELANINSTIVEELLPRATRFQSSNV